jgi:hypothetical protein
VPDHVTPYDRFALSDVDLERLLVTGQMREELTAYFGEDEYRELTRLAKRAARATPAGPTVIIVPGVMGSQLGLPRPAPLPADILWLDPIDIQRGRLTELRMPVGAVRSLGVVLFSYFRIKLQLRAAGFKAHLHDYDWRLPLETLGRGLAARLAAEPGELAVVAHSMGGLVVRAALGLHRCEHVVRVILLGTPNAGSFAPVQALRGTYSVVRAVARLAPDSPEALAQEVFSTFPSLYQLLPRERCGGELDLFDAGQWPTTGPQPDRQLLVQARGTEGLLAPVEARFVAVAGVGQETVTGIERRGEDFIYTVTRHGDGTVPMVSAELPGAQHYYAQVSHSDLTRDAAVAAAVVDLLRKGGTRRLPSRFRGASRAQAQVSDTELRRTHVTKLDWAGLTADDRRTFLQTLNEGPKLRLRVPALPKARRRRTASSR